MKPSAIEANVTGRVQGVFFRQSTKGKADSLSLGGWVENCSDGSVALYACGDETAIKEFIEWLHKGPPAAHVTDVDWQEVDYVAVENFTIKR